MLYLACYDFENDNIRLAVAKHLILNGYERIQKSVFVGLQKPKERKRLETWISKKLDKDVIGSFVIIPIPQNMVSEIFQVGNQEPDWAYLSGKIETLIF